MNSRKITNNTIFRIYDFAILTLSLKYAVKKWRVAEKRYFSFMAFPTKWIYGFTLNRKVFFANALLPVQLTNSALPLFYQNTLKTGVMSE